MVHHCNLLYPQLHCQRLWLTLTTIPHTPVTTLPARSTPSQGNDPAVIDTLSANTPMPVSTTAQDRYHQVEVLTPCTRQYDRFVDPQGRPLQPGTIFLQ